MEATQIVVKELKGARAKEQGAFMKTGGCNNIDSLYPNDFFSINDIAFGYLTNGEFVAAADFKNQLVVETGYVSHSLMLVMWAIL